MNFPRDTPVRDRLQAQALAFAVAAFFVVAVVLGIAIQGYMTWIAVGAFLGVAVLFLGGPLAWALWRLAKAPAWLLDNPPRPASGGLRLIIGPLLILAAVGVAVLYTATEVERLKQSPPAVTHLSGEVGHLHGYGRTYGRGSHGPRIDLQFAGDPRWFHSECDWYCDAYAPLAGYFDRPWPMAEADVVGDQIVGLKVAGRTYFTPAQEQARQIKSSRLWLRIWLGVLAPLTALVVLVLIRIPRMTPYTGPNFADEVRARRLVVKAMHGKRS